MNLLEWQSWPLGPIPIFLTVWGVYWILHIYEKPGKHWLAYENSNNFAVYGVAATLAVGLAYIIRRQANAPIYVFHLNWLPLLSTAIAVVIAEMIERILRARLGYAPVVEFVRLKSNRFRSSHTQRQNHIEDLKLFLWPLGAMCVAVAWRDTDFFNPKQYDVFNIYGILLGDIHSQAGVMWVITAVLAATFRGGVTVYLNRRDTQNDRG